MNSDDADKDEWSKLTDEFEEDFSNTVFPLVPTTRVFPYVPTNQLYSNELYEKTKRERETALIDLTNHLIKMMTFCGNKSLIKNYNKLYNDYVTIHQKYTNIVNWQNNHTGGLSKRTYKKNIKNRRTRVKR